MTVLAWFWKSKNQEGQRPRAGARRAAQGEGIPSFISMFYLGIRRPCDPHPCWGGHLLAQPLIQILTSPESPSQIHQKDPFTSIWAGPPLAQASWHIEATITPERLGHPGEGTVGSESSDINNESRPARTGGDGLVWPGVSDTELTVPVETPARSSSSRRPGPGTGMRERELALGDFPSGLIRAPGPSPSWGP